VLNNSQQFFVSAMDENLRRRNYCWRER